MARNDIITPKVERMIFDAFKLNPNVTAKEIMNAVHVELGEIDSKSNTWPGLSKVQQVIRKIKRHPPTSEDMPWCVYTMRETTAVRPDDLPVVLQAFVYARETLHNTFTIRDAKWVARLRFLIKDTSKDIGKLTRSALDYSEMEIYEEIMPTSTDSILMDLQLFAEYTGEVFTWEGERLQTILSADDEWLWHRSDVERAAKKREPFLTPLEPDTYD